MTQTTELTQRRIEAEAALHRIAEELSRAQQDAELFVRLKAAADLAKRLEPQFSSAMDTLAAAKAAEKDAIDEARFADLVDIEVRETPATVAESVLRTSFEVTYTRNQYNMSADATVPTPVQVTGFEGLPDNVFAFLLTKHPNKIPNKIMAFAPGDPEAAFTRYFRDLRRGWSVQ